MFIQHPTVGPIVGYTTPSQVRIWLRGMFEPVESTGYRRSFGVAQIRRSQDQTRPVTAKPDHTDVGYGDPVYVKLPPYFDMSGVCVFTGLSPDTLYEYRVGWFFAETEPENLDRTQMLVWKNPARGAFRTVPATAASRSYVVGSCRYLLRLFNGLIFDERGDKAFASILDQIGDPKNPLRTDALMMIGDQIYADDLNILAPDSTLDQFLSRYRVAFSQDNMRRLMSVVPTYMMLDDHEIEDNWPVKASDKDWVSLYPHAIHAYQIYQCSHSPLFDLDADGYITGTLQHLWYSFNDGCCDCFFLDTRTERNWDDKHPEKRHIISEKQMQAFLDWLADGSGQVKLVVSAVPFFPDLQSDSVDKWSGYPADRQRVLDHILANKARKVIFVSGDVHCSFSCELRTTADPSFKVVQVVSSSFFWPYPHMGESDFAFHTALKDTGATVYDVSGAAKTVCADDNFTRLDITADDVTVTTFNRKGKHLAQSNHVF